MAQFVVVGAGIIGASIAWHLARSGADVVVVDGGMAGGLATPHSWAWINASAGHPDHYARLRLRSLEEWRRLDGLVPGVQVNWCGSLVWDLPEAGLRGFIAERQAQGHDIRAVDRQEIAALEPALLDPPDLAAYSPAEGAIEPLEVTQALLVDAERRGAGMMIGQAVERLLSADGRVTGVRLADGTEIEAWTVILAAGAATGPLAAQAGVEVPVDDPPGLLVSTEPVEPLLNGLVVGPGLELRQLADGRLLGSGLYSGGEPLREAEALLDAIRSSVRGGEALRMGGHTISHRPVPNDGFPILGPTSPGLHVAVTHSGVTLAPVIGRFVAEELMRERRDPLLAPFGPERFAG